MSNAAASLLVELTHRGVELAAAGNRLRYRPLDAVNGELREQLLHNKRDLLIVVHQMSAPPLPTGTWGRCASALLARVPHDDRRAALREAFEERAAVAQYDGNLSVDDAERLAFVQLCHVVTREGRAALQPTGNKMPSNTASSGEGTGHYTRAPGDAKEGTTR